MHILNNQFSLDAFFEKLRTQESLLLLDYDGTLAPFVNDPSEAVPYPGVMERIEKLRKCSRTRCIIVSGRALDSLIPLIPLDPLPELWGCHGAERLTKENKRISVPLSKEQKAGLEQAKAIAYTIVPHDRCELKPFSIAAHWRGMSQEQQEQIKSELLAQWTQLVQGKALEVHAFDGGLELRISGMNKGGAVRTILQESPHSKDCVAYLGDDATDEQAFEELGDRGVKVLVRK